MYIKTGKVRFVYYHFIVIPGTESFRAAEASECAADQGKFWDYHDLLFENQAGENTGAFADARLKAFAAQLGLDATKFNGCLDGNQHRDTVDASNAQAQALGVHGTPTLFVVSEGRRIEVNNPMSFTEIQSIVDGELKRLGGQ